MKNRLVADDDLMVAGSDAYVNYTNNVSDILPVNHILDFNQPEINYKIDYIKLGSPFFVRESGVYIVFTVVSIDTAAQFTYFVNGNVVPFTAIGSNAGAGQIVSRHMLKLKKNDNVIVRNYITTSASLETNIMAGGTQVGNSATFLMMKIAPYESPCWDECRVSRSTRRLFHKLTEKLICDRELMVRGFDVTGTFLITSVRPLPLKAMSYSLRSRRFVAWSGRLLPQRKSRSAKTVSTRSFSS